MHGMLGTVLGKVLDLTDNMLALVSDFVDKVRNPVFFEEAKKFLRGEPCWVDKIVDTASDLLRVTVDYTKSIAEMIKVNNFGWFNDDVTDKHFPVKGSGQSELEFKVHDFGRAISSEDAIAEADKMGFRVAEPIEGLAFAVKYPDVQRKNPIVVLGSPWRDLNAYRRVLVLRGDVSRRGLSLFVFGGDWVQYDRFLLVRKQS